VRLRRTWFTNARDEPAAMPPAIGFHQRDVEAEGVPGGRRVVSAGVVCGRLVLSVGVVAGGVVITPPGGHHQCGVHQRCCTCGI
jgi:hypothetical protein